MSDNYEFEKSMQSQSTDDYSPYVDKQSNGYINDINNGVYTNNSLTLVNFDLGQIYNSQKFTDTEDLFVVLPITMVAAYAAAGGTIVAPSAGSSNLCSIKTNFVNLIHQADLCC
jgi:DNA helicase IV